MNWKHKIHQVPVSPRGAQVPMPMPTEMPRSVAAPLKAQRITSAMGR